MCEDAFSRSSVSPPPTLDWEQNRHENVLPLFMMPVVSSSRRNCYPSFKRCMNLACERRRMCVEHLRNPTVSGWFPPLDASEGKDVSILIIFPQSGGSSRSPCPELSAVSTLDLVPISRAKLHLMLFAFFVGISTTSGSPPPHPRQSSRDTIEALIEPAGG